MPRKILKLIQELESSNNPITIKEAKLLDILFQRKLQAQMVLPSNFT